jgi:hypothetical protein
MIEFTVANYVPFFSSTHNEFTTEVVHSTAMFVQLQLFSVQSIEIIVISFHM